MHASRWTWTATAFVAVALSLGCSGSQPVSETPEERPKQRRLMIDDDAPLGTVQDSEGGTVELGSVLRGNLTVVVFYRGDW